MNKAFVREPEADGNGYCPRCGSLGIPVKKVTLDNHLPGAARRRLGDSGWFCGFARCDVVYFDEFESSIDVSELQAAVYPKDPAAPICACFGFELDDIEADVREGTPTRIRELLAKSKTDKARCRTLAADGQCCLSEVQRLYMRGVAEGGE